MTQRSLSFIVVLLATLAAFPAAAANSCTSSHTAPVAVNDFVDWPAGPLVIPVLQNDRTPMERH
jgi:hypothetical protein